MYPVQPLSLSAQKAWTSHPLPRVTRMANGYQPVIRKKLRQLVVLDHPGILNRARNLWKT